MGGLEEEAPAVLCQKVDSRSHSFQHPAWISLGVVLVPHALVSQLGFHSASHLRAVVEGLLGSGWAAVSLPEGLSVPRNGLLLEARTKSEYRRASSFIRSANRTGNQPDERRLQITTTYDKGLEAKPGYQDVVLGDAIGANLRWR